MIPVLRYLATRVLNALVVALLVPFLTLFLLGRAPGDYLSELAVNPLISPTTLTQLRADYGLDQPLHIKYALWAGNLAHGNLGFSLVYQRPIGELIGSRIWNTVLLNALALLAVWSLGVGIALLSEMPPGNRQRSVTGWMAGAASTLMVSTPAVLLALVLLVLAIPMGLPVGGMSFDSFRDAVRHLLLPVAAVSAVWLPMVIRHTRTAIGRALQEQYVVTARAKGLGRMRILLHHAFRNALNPLATLFGLSVSALLSASLPVEVVMGWPGLGQLTYDAVLKRDIFLVMDLTMAAALLLLAGTAIGDMLVYVTDPRIADGDAR